MPFSYGVHLIDSCYKELNSLDLLYAKNFSMENKNLWVPLRKIKQSNHVKMEPTFSVEKNSIKHIVVNLELE